jgi:hypothetical protein
LEIWNLEVRYSCRRKKIMAKITAVIPEPREEYDVSNQLQLNEGLNTLKNELNFGYQKDLKNEQAQIEWFLT